MRSRFGEPELQRPQDKSVSGQVNSLADMSDSIRSTREGHILPGLLLSGGDGENPLNWSYRKKHQVLVALASASLLCDWGMTWGTTLFEAQAETWQMSIPAVANSISGGILMQGVGGILAVPVTHKCGRLPVLFWSQVLSCLVIIGASLSPSYAGFTTCRTLQGLFNTAPQVIGLSMIHDMFLFHDRARKVNLWAFSYLCGPFAGAFISALLVEKLSWRAVYGVLAGLHAFSVLVIVLLGEETLFDRSSCPNTAAIEAGQKVKPHKLRRLVGYSCVPKNAQPQLSQLLRSLVHIGISPQILLPAAIFTCINFMWAIGIITTITQFLKPFPYLFSSTATALMYLAPLVGVILAEIWGHFFNDFLQDRYVQRHDSVCLIENRLWAVYPVVVISMSGLILYGQTLQHHLHWVGLAVGWAMIAAGFLAATTVVETYALDCFPSQAAAAAGWINFWRTTGGFCVSYFQLKWVGYSGAAVTFACQAGILGVASSAIVATHVWGSRWRQMQTPLRN